MEAGLAAGWQAKACPTNFHEVSRAERPSQQVPRALRAATPGFRRLRSAIRTEEAALPGIQPHLQARQPAQGARSLGSAWSQAHHLAGIADRLIAPPPRLPCVGGA